MNKGEIEKITYDETFLRRFRTKERVMRLTDKEVDVLRTHARRGDAYAEYAYGRWLYYNCPEDSSMGEAEEMFQASKLYVPDSLAAYAMMLRYGETKANMMDIEESNKLLLLAIKRGSERATQQMARLRIFGFFCDAEPEQVAKEIEKRIKDDENCDPQWYTLLAYAYEELGRKEDAISVYEQSIELGELNHFFLANIYHDRGNMALYEELMEEGIKKGCPLCFTLGTDMDESDFEELPEDEQEQLHRLLDDRLRHGMQLGSGTCAFYLWMFHYYGGLGYEEDVLGSAVYLKRGAALASTDCLAKIAELAEYGEWPETMTETQIAELWLRALRYIPTDKMLLSKLSLISDPAFLLKHKDELERYWKPRFPRKTERAVPPTPQKTPIDPTVIIIWPTGHLELAKADVYRMKSYREMGQALIGADALDAVHYAPLLRTIRDAAETDMDLVMYVDRDAAAKNLPDNAIGTLLYGRGVEVRGPIIICQEDLVHDCHSFKTEEDVVRTYTEISKHSNGLLVVKDEEDGKYDAWV